SVMTFFVSRYALDRYSQALTEIQRQTSITEDTNRLLGGVLATMREAVLIVDSQMRVALYNDAAASTFKLPGKNAGRPASLAGDIGDTSPREEKQAPGSSSIATELAESNRGSRLTDVTRDPAINDAFRRVHA